MTQGSDMIDAALETLHAHLGVSVTYTEPGVAGQAVTALEIRTKARGNGDLYQEFVLRTSTLTINAEDWRGAQITASDGSKFTIEDRGDSSGVVTFKAVRALERS